MGNSEFAGSASTSPGPPTRSASTSRFGRKMCRCAPCGRSSKPVKPSCQHHGCPAWCNWISSLVRSGDVLVMFILCIQQIPSGYDML